MDNLFLYIGIFALVVTLVAFYLVYEKQTRLLKEVIARKEEMIDSYRDTNSVLGAENQRLSLKITEITNTLIENRWLNFKNYFNKLLAAPALGKIPVNASHVEHVNETVRSLIENNIVVDNVSILRFKLPAINSSDIDVRVKSIKRVRTYNTIVLELKTYGAMLEVYLNKHYGILVDNLLVLETDKLSDVIEYLQQQSIS